MPKLVFQWLFSVLETYTHFMNHALYDFSCKYQTFDTNLSLQVCVILLWRMLMSPLIISKIVVIDESSNKSHHSRPYS